MSEIEKAAKIYIFKFWFNVIWGAVIVTALSIVLFGA